MVRIGLIGAGFMGTTHGRAFASIPGAKVLTILDRDPAKALMLAQEIGSTVAADVESVLCDPGIEVLDITVPIAFHPQFAVQAFQAGKHVIIEKPLALSVSEADTILDAVQRSGKYLMVAHVIRFWPEYEAVQEVLNSGRLGRPLLATACRFPACRSGRIGSGTRSNLAARCWTFIYMTWTS